MAKITICNMCGKKFNEYDENSEFNISTQIGYGSKYDGNILELDLCNDCMDKIISECKVSPVIEDTAW